MRVPPSQPQRPGQNGVRSRLHLGGGLALSVSLAEALSMPLPDPHPTLSRREKGNNRWQAWVLAHVSEGEGFVRLTSPWARPGGALLPLHGNTRRAEGQAARALHRRREEKLGFWHHTTEETEGVFSDPETIDPYIPPRRSVSSQYV
jgi:hypothetical protein